MVWLLLAGCARPTGTVDVVAPALAPLVRVVSFRTDREVTAVVQADDGEGTVVSVATPAGLDHQASLVGLKPDRSWDVSVVVDGRVFATAAFATDPLPSPFPNITLNAADPEAMAPGVTLLPLTTDGAAWLVAVDDAGEVVWLYGDGTPFYEVAPLPGGLLLGQREEDLVELDWTGATRARWVANPDATEDIAVDTWGFHHDAQLTTRSTFAALSTSTRAVDDYPLDYADPTARGTVSILADAIVEFDADGLVLDRWELADVLDPTRVGYDGVELGADGKAQWGHANAVSEDGAGWLVSMRNQDAILSLQRDGSLNWILANPANWSPALAAERLQPVDPAFRWPYHQHAPEREAETDRILLFDNGNWQASPFTGEPTVPFADWSARLVELEVDPAAMTVAQTWEWTPDPPLCSPAMGDVDRLDNGDVLALFAYVENVGGEPVASLGRADPFTKAVEVTAAGELAWDVDFWAPDGEPGWQSYRAVRVALP